MEGSIPPYGAGGILFQNKRVLTVVEKETDLMVLRWAGMRGIPMGRPEPQDQSNPAITVVREFKEETGLETRIVELVAKYEVGELKIPLHIYLLRLVEDKTVQDHELETSWIAIEKLMEMNDSEVRYPTKQAIDQALKSANRRS